MSKNYCGAGGKQEQLAERFFSVTSYPELNSSCETHDKDYGWLLSTSMPWYTFLYEKFKIDTQFFVRNVSNGSITSRILGGGFGLLVYVATPYFLLKKK